MTEAIALIIGLMLGVALVRKLGDNTAKYIELLLSTVLDVLILIKDEDKVDINKIFRLIIERLDDVEIDTSLIKDVVMDILWQDS